MKSYVRNDAQNTNTFKPSKYESFIIRKLVVVVVEMVFVCKQGARYGKIRRRPGMRIQLIICILLHFHCCSIFLFYKIHIWSASNLIWRVWERKHCATTLYTQHNTYYGYERAVPDDVINKIRPLYKSVKLTNKYLVVHTRQLGIHNNASHSWIIENSFLTAMDGYCKFLQVFIVIHGSKWPSHCS